MLAWALYLPAYGLVSPLFALFAPGTVFAAAALALPLVGLLARWWPSAQAGSDSRQPFRESLH